MNIAGRVAVVTGAASGIGRATALALAGRGAAVVLADVNEHRLDEVRTEVETLGRRALAVRCDVTSDADVAQLAAAALASFGQVDVLFNNAGVVLRGALEDIEIADWQWQLDVNVLGVVRGVRAFLPRMLERGSGYIVNTASVAGLFALTGEGAPYIASKFAVVGLTEALALYCRPRGIGVSVLCPGSVDTNLGETGRTIGMTPERALAETAVAATVQGNVLMRPAQVGEAVVEGIEHERFFILPDDRHLATLRHRLEDWEAFLTQRLRGGANEPEAPHGGR